MCDRQHFNALFNSCRSIRTYLFAKFVINIVFVMCEETYYDVIAFMVIADRERKRRETFHSTQISFIPYMVVEPSARFQTEMLCVFAYLATDHCNEN